MDNVAGAWKKTRNSGVRGLDGANLIIILYNQLEDLELGGVVAANTGDLLQIVDEQVYLGQQLLNVYYYRWFSVPSVDNTVYSALVDDFQSRVMNDVCQLQGELLIHTSLTIKNLSNNVDFFEKPISVTGQRTMSASTALPSYVSVGFKLIRDSLVTRNGFKRFGGLNESEVQGNSWVGAINDINNVEDALAEFLQIGLVDVAAPIIPKRPITPPMGTLYPYSSVASAQYSLVGTQNTRKAGRGV